MFFDMEAGFELFWDRCETGKKNLLSAKIHAIVETVGRPAQLCSGTPERR
jgi:hypothetical protein